MRVLSSGPTDGEVAARSLDVSYILIATARWRKAPSHPGPLQSCSPLSARTAAHAVSLILWNGSSHSNLIMATISAAYAPTALEASLMSSSSCLASSMRTWGGGGGQPY